MDMSISPEHTCTSICPAPRTRNRMPAIAGQAAPQKGAPPAAAVAGRGRRRHVRRRRGRPAAGADRLSAPWCEPCRQLGLTVEQAASDFAGRLKVVTVNVDDAPAVAQRLGVQSVPTLVVLHHGREVARRVGALPAAALNDWLGAVLQAAA